MKKNLQLWLAGTLLLGTSALNAQVIFSEDFDGISGPTSGGAGTYSFPNGWFLRNVDNRTPASGVAYVNEAWERREDFSFNVADSCAFSTSWYSPTGAAEDWMWTPLIPNLPSNVVLTWNAVTYDAMYPDGYEVRIMTATQGPPTGGTGVMGNQLTNSTLIFNTAAENSSWTAHSVSLNAYAGQGVYIGFRNNSNDKFLLLIDDIVVSQVVNYDAEVLTPDTVSQYSIVPQTQVQPLVFNAGIRNNGLQAVTNVMLKVDVYNSTNTNVYSATSSPLASLGSSATSNFTVAPYTPPMTPDIYTVRYQTLINETDDQPSNDTLRRNNILVVHDSVYARDAGPVVSGLGIGAGNGGYIGQEFEVVATDTVTSVTFAVTRGYTNTKAALVFWDMQGGMPNAIVAGTDTMLYPDDSADVYTIPMSGGYTVFNPGTYVVTAVEFDSTLQLGQVANIFSTGTVWVNWPTNPFGNWTNVEAFGSGFAKTSVIRPNFGHPVVLTTGTGENSSSMLVNVFPNPASDELYLNIRSAHGLALFELFNMTGEKVMGRELGQKNEIHERIALSSLPAGIYNLVVKTDGQLITKKIVVTR
jgi:hypothetical protein